MNQINRLYIHIPFCQSKCSYCAFHSVPISTNDILINQFLTKLEKDIKESQHLTVPIQSIFIGGGTPSYLNAKYIEKLFTIIFNNFIIADNAEISFESNPESLSEEKISIIANFANRISIGIQSFNQKHRSIIGRIGNNNNINNLIETIVKYNIDMSVDLIYGIPTQTIDDWKEELNSAVKLPIKHLSAYALTFEEGSILYSDKSLNSFMSNELTADMFNLTSDILLQSGFNKYEISNFSLPGYECRHNLDIWFGGRYLGLGPTASSFDGTTRWTQPKFNEWLQGKEPEIDRISRIKRTIEIFIMGLRTTHGWTAEQKRNKNRRLISPFPHNLEFKATDWKEINRKLYRLNKDGLLKIIDIGTEKTGISPTEKGLLFWNEIALQLI